MNADNNRNAWHRCARRLARRMNAGFWLAGFLPLVFVASLGQAFVHVGLRKAELGTAPAWIAFAALLIAAAGFAWWRQRRRFFSKRDALVFVEARLGLNNGLSAAEEGAARWPEPLPVSPFPRWSWQRIAPWPAWALAVLALGAWLPVGPAGTPTPAGPPVEPVAWSELESWIESFEEAEVLEEASLEELRERLGELRGQESRDWYRHGSLEATDALRRQTEHAIRDFRENLESAARVLAAADAFPEGLPSGREAALREELDRAVAGFEDSLLRLEPGVLGQLQELDLQALPAMSESDLEALREALEAGLAACGVCLGDGEGGDPAALAALGAPGGIGKGPAPAPLTFREEAAGSEVARLESVRGGDLSRAALGERVGVGEAGEPGDEPVPYRGPAEAGAVAGPGTGGEAVAHETFTPGEQAVLERYFR